MLKNFILINNKVMLMNSNNEYKRCTRWIKLNRSLFGNNIILKLNYGFFIVCKIYYLKKEIKKQLSIKIFWMKIINDKKR